jgi:CDP-glucose 4,6-dehydratase
MTAFIAPLFHPKSNAMISADFWRGKTVLITGHTGFKGAWLSLWLVSLGARVVGFSRRPREARSLFEFVRLAELIVDIDGDVCDSVAMDMAIARHAPDVVIHMAAQTLVRESYRNPVETYATNVMGLVNLLEAVRRTKIPRVVLVITSDKCYEAHADETQPHREGDAMGGHDPYSSSKGCAELIVSAYRRSYFMDGTTAVASARAGNIIGGGDFSQDRLIPDLVSAMSAGRTAAIRNPMAIRPWQFVTDPLSGYMTLAQKLWDNPRQFAEGWNFGPHGEPTVTVAQLCDRACSLWGQSRWAAAVESTSPHERGVLQLDTHKAAERLGFIPRLSIEEALVATVDWYKAWVAGRDMRLFTLLQIKNLGPSER